MSKNISNLSGRIGSSSVKFFTERDPAQLPWNDLDIDIVFECTGFFTSKYSWFNDKV